MLLGSRTRLSRQPASQLRATFGHFATGVVALTAREPDTDKLLGLTANSFASVSLEPPLVSICISHDSTSWPRMRRVPRQTISILSAQQIFACRQLAGKGDGKFDGLALVDSPGGSPILDGALAWLECAVRQEYPAGDHNLVIMQVVDHGRLRPDDQPLVFYRSEFGGFSQSAGASSASFSRNAPFTTDPQPGDASHA
ncbi:flavin reductase family protein [Nonomuraea angiospora]|uniref:flavin reductase family protein n=1 Tax=Nonomuraea angiospora TaxID=46172 RepID=UPI00378CCB75